MSTPNISRDTINRVVARLQNDPAFKAQANADPIAALQSEGVPAEAVSDLIHEGLITPDVQGYTTAPIQKCNITCWSTCFVTE